jgi:hypothetical protein
VSGCLLHRFVIPPLVVGTLDSLMALSDDLAKFNSQTEVRIVSLTIMVLVSYESIVAAGMILLHFVFAAT